METSTQLASLVMDQVEQEVQELLDRNRDLQTQLPELTAEKDAAWEEFAPKGSGDSPIDEEAAHRYDIAFKREMAVMNAIKKNEAAIRKLRSPEEFDRRMEHEINARGGIKRMADEKTKTKKETARDQGVPDVYLNSETGNFKIGADARYKSDLVSSALGLEDGNRLMDFEPKDAEKRLAQRDWTPFLDRKREILAEKERKAAERAEAREQAAREKAEAKEKAAAEKQAAAASKADGEVTPDPKPSSGKGKSRAKTAA